MVVNPSLLFPQQAVGQAPFDFTKSVNPFQSPQLLPQAPLLTPANFSGFPAAAPITTSGVDAATALNNQIQSMFNTFVAQQTPGNTGFFPVMQPQALVPGIAFNGALGAAIPGMGLPGAAFGAVSQGDVLRQSLGAIESDPEGAKLIAAARARGVYIEVGDPGSTSAATGTGSLDRTSAVHCTCPDCQQVAADGTTVINGLTLTTNGQSHIIVRDPSNIKTIVHELVHAVSPEDGDSREEEGIADVIGNQIALRLGGAGASGGSDLELFLSKQQFYPGLMQSNDIRQSLALLGLNVSV